MHERDHLDIIIIKPIIRNDATLFRLIKILGAAEARNFSPNQCKQQTRSSVVIAGVTSISFRNLSPFHYNASCIMQEMVWSWQTEPLNCRHTTREEEEDLLSSFFGLVVQFRAAILDVIELRGCARIILNEMLVYGSILEVGHLIFIDNIHSARALMPFSPTEKLNCRFII